METEWKDPSLEQALQKQSCRSYLRQARSPTPSSQLLAFLWYFFKYIFFLFFVCFKGTRARSLGLPCQTQCRGPSWGRVSAFPWRWARHSCPQGQEVLSSFYCASLAGSALLSNSLPTQTFLSAAMNSSGLVNHWCNHRVSVPLAIVFSSGVLLLQRLSILGSSSRHNRQSWKWSQEERACLVTTTHR